MRERTKLTSLVVGILFIALVLRLWGIGFGLPYEYHVDEVQYVRQAASMGANGLEPVWWNNPPFYKYVLLGEYAGLFGIGKLLGWYSSVADFGAQNVLDPTWLYLLGRGTSALLGTLTVLVVYWLGKATYDRRVGLLAAWFLAVCFIHVRDSHYAVNDIPLTFFVTVALLAAVKIVESGDKKWYALAGIALGLGFATKYSAASALVPIVLAHFFSPGVQLKARFRLQVHRLAIALAAAGLAAIVASPYFVLTPGRVIQDAYEALYLAGRQGFDGWQIDPAGGYIFYLKSLWWGLGVGLFVLCLSGIAWTVVKRQPVSLVLLSFPMLLYLFMGQQNMFFARFILPAVPPLLVLAASAAGDLLEQIASWTDARRSVAFESVALLIIVIFVTAQPITSSIRHGYLLTQNDTRTLAKEWIEVNILEGVRIAVDWPHHGPSLSTLDDPEADSNRTYDVWLVGGHGLPDHSLEYYQAEGYEYLIASSFIYNIPLVDEHRDAERQVFYTSLDEELELVQDFQPYEGDSEPMFTFEEIYGPAVSLWQRERPGPTLKIFRVER